MVNLASFCAVCCQTVLPDSVTRQLSFNRTDISGKYQSYKKAQIRILFLSVGTLVAQQNSSEGLNLPPKMYPFRRNSSCPQNSSEGLNCHQICTLFVGTLVAPQNSSEELNCHQKCTLSVGTLLAPQNSSDALNLPPKMYPFRNNSSCPTKFK